MADDPPASTSRPIPTRVGRYEVLLPIARGGMATVYLARSQGARGFARDVALKLTHAHLTEDGSDFATILLEEARIASRIKHRNVVSILDVGEDPLGLFLVMDYVEGDTLDGLQRGAKARKEPVPLRIAIRILLDALAGLHAAHELKDEQGLPMAVVHRDFSPQNILVGLDGVAQLADFGIAKAADRGGETAAGVVKGKVTYMAPEHARSHAVDRRADVWSAGVVAWELFAGHRLHPKDEGVQTLLKVVTERPPLLGTEVKDIGPDVEGVIARALEPDVDLRCPTAAVFARDLASAFGITARLADHEEVAEYVRRMAGAKLEKRRAQIQDALRLRAEGAAPIDVAPEEPQPAAAPEPEASVPSAPSLLSTRISMVEAAPKSESRGRASPPGRESPARKWLLGGALGLAVCAGVGFLLLGRGSRHAIESTVAESPPVATPPPTPSPVAEASFAASPRSIVQLHANARVDSLRVNTRSFSLTPPAADLEFERLAEDGDGPLTVVATSADGRRRAATLAPGATSLNIDFLSFPPRPSLGTPVRSP